MAWPIVATYVAIWLLYGWRLSVHLLDAEVRRSLDSYRSLYGGPDGARRAADNWLGSSLMAGFGLALAWPVVAPFRGLYRLVSGAGLFTTPAEVEYAEQRELEELRKLAREHGLPMPGGER